MPDRANARPAAPRRTHGRRTLTPLLLALLAAPAAQAIEIDTGNPDWTLRWDNTVKYSLMQRLKSASPTLSAQPPLTVNQDDGDNNFKKGLVSNRLDLLTELDLAGPGYGARVSGAAWYDSVYNGKTDNTSFTANHRPGSEFTTDTRDLMGRKAEFLDAFVFGSFDIDGRPATVRLGRHTLLYGESLFFGANGIAGGMSPVDVVKEWGFAGLLMVRAYLDRARGG